MKKSWIKITLISMSLLLVAGIAYKVVSKSDEATAKEERNLPEIRIEPIRVRTATAKRKTLVQSVSATGIAEAIRRVQISARITAELMKLNVKEGGFYRACDTLLQFSDKEFRIALQDAKEEYLKAQSDYATQRSDYAKLAPSEKNKNNLEDLRRKLEEAERGKHQGKSSEKEIERLREEVEFAEILSGEKLDDVLRSRSGFSRAKTQLQRVELNLQNTVIRAPFDGFASGIKVSQGQFVATGQLCMEFVDISRIWVEVGILEKEVGYIKAGNRAKVIFSAFAKDTLYGSVTAVSPIISTETKTAKVIIELANPQFRIKPGMYATVYIQAAFFPNRLVVPKQAIVERDGRKIVFVAEKQPDGKELAKWHYVQTGEENETEIEIVEGLEEGDEVIIENNFTLSHDMPISKMP